jgi:uncharacterized phosphatase
MKIIYFVRHAQSQATADKIAAGGEFDPPLTNEGRKQALEAGKKLKNKEVDLIASSPLSRSLETAKIIAKEIGYDLNKVKTNPIFVERGLGVYSGKPLKTFQQDYENNELHQSVETVEDLSRRIDEGLKWLAKQKSEHIVLVSHGDVSRALRLKHKNLPHSHLYELERHGNAEIYEFTID